MAETTPCVVTVDRLIDAYSRYFEAILVDDDPKLLHEVYRLRYHVYCVEHQFENPDDFPDQLEHDKFDVRSLHSLLIHRPSGTIAGTVRLIIPDACSAAKPNLPIDQLCRDPAWLELPPTMRNRMGEVSRFAVSKSFRRRIGEAGSPTAVTDESLEAMDSARRDMKDRRLAPHITLGLIESLMRMSTQAGVTHWCSVMERALLRLLKRIGIHFENLGPEVDYHGKRQPCFQDVSVLLERVKQERFDVWEVLTRRGVTRLP